MACGSVHRSAGGPQPRGGVDLAPDVGGAAGPGADVAADPDPAVEQAVGEAAVRAKLNAIQEKNRRSQQRYRERQRVPIPVDDWAGSVPLAPQLYNTASACIRCQCQFVWPRGNFYMGVATGGTRGISMPREVAYAAARGGLRSQSQLGAARVRAGGPRATECAA